MNYTTLGQTKVEIRNLIENYKPMYMCAKKRRLFADALLQHGNDDFSGEKSCLELTRIGFRNDSACLVKHDVKVESVPYFYDYGDSDLGNVWYVNFADPVLFVAYDSDLFAQDEIQTLEMPLLGSCQRYLEEKALDGLEIYTQVHGVPTPYLIKNVPQWMTVNTSPVMPDGRVESIYGYMFEESDEETVRAGVKVLEGQRFNNIMAISAAVPGEGTYSKDDIRLLLKTLLCSFDYVVENPIGGSSEDLTAKTVIHTGNWGCGAFGGNRELTYVLTIYSACVCKVDRLVLHGVSDDCLDRAKAVVAALDGNMTIEEVVDSLYERRYQWGESDGN